MSDCVCVWVTSCSWQGCGWDMLWLSHTLIRFPDCTTHQKFQLSHPHISPPHKCFWLSKSQLLYSSTGAKKKSHDSAEQFTIHKLRQLKGYTSKSTGCNQLYKKQTKAPTSFFWVNFRRSTHSSFSLFANACYKMNLANTSKVRAGNACHCHVAK